MGIQVANVSMGWYGYGYGANIETWHKGETNSAGGAGVQLSFCITGTKKTKYVIFRFIPYNSVNDIVADSISGDPVKGGQFTGFCNPGEWQNNIMWENLWYNSSIRSVGIKEVILQYEDGTEETIPKDSIEFVQHSSGGCYVATAVYGSYDCPQVWTLRRYRDYSLAETWYGRAFIRTYYAISPTLVKWFGDTTWFKNMWRGKLDSMVDKLKAKGFEDTPYDDIDWK